MKRFLVLAGILIGISAFFYLKAHNPEPPQSFQTPLPGRDEVAVSGSFRLSMNAYETLRARYPSLQPIHLVQLGLYSQWLVSGIDEKTDVLADATRCVRAVMKPPLSPGEVNEIETILKKTFTLSSFAQLEKEIHDAWGTRSIEWNPILLKEYGIEVPPTPGNSG